MAIRLRSGGQTTDNGETRVFHRRKNSRPKGQEEKSEPIFFFIDKELFVINNNASQTGQTVNQNTINNLLYH